MILSLMQMINVMFQSKNSLGKQNKRNKYKLTMIFIFYGFKNGREKN